MMMFFICRTNVFFKKDNKISCIRHKSNLGCIIKTWFGINITLYLQEEQARLVYNGGAAAQTEMNHVSCEGS